MKAKWIGLIALAVFVLTGNALAFDIAGHIDFRDPPFGNNADPSDDCVDPAAPPIPTFCEKTVNGILIRIEGWEDTNGTVGLQTEGGDPDTMAPLWWDEFDGFGVQASFEPDEIEGPEFLVVRFLNNTDPGQPGQWEYVTQVLSELNFTDLFYEGPAGSEYPEEGNYMFTVGVEEFAEITFVAVGPPAAPNGALDLPVPCSIAPLSSCTPATNDENADYITFTAPGLVNEGLPNEENHEFSLAGMTIQTLTFNLTVFPVGTGTGTVTSSPPGITCGSGGSDCDEPYASGELVTLTPTADPDSIFTGWTGDPGCLDGSVLMDTSKFCTATFTQTHTLIITPVGTGSGSTTGGGTYNEGDTATVSATPDAGSTFDGWTGPDGTECATGSVLMDTSKFCTATFTQITQDGPIGGNVIGMAGGSMSSSSYKIIGGIGGQGPTGTINSDNYQLEAGFAAGVTGG